MPRRSLTLVLTNGGSREWKDDGLDEDDFELNERKMISDEIVKLATKNKVGRKVATAVSYRCMWRMRCSRQCFDYTHVESHGLSQTLRLNVGSR